MSQVPCTIMSYICRLWWGMATWSSLLLVWLSGMKSTALWGIRILNFITGFHRIGLWPELPMKSCPTKFGKIWSWYWFPIIISWLLSFVTNWWGLQEKFVLHNIIHIHFPLSFMERTLVFKFTCRIAVTGLLCCLDYYIRAVINVCLFQLPTTYSYMLVCFSTCFKYSFNKHLSTYFLSFILILIYWWTLGCLPN